MSITDGLKERLKEYISSEDKERYLGDIKSLAKEVVSLFHDKPITDPGLSSLTDLYLPLSVFVDDFYSLEFEENIIYNLSQKTSGVHDVDIVQLMVRLRNVLIARGLDDVFLMKRIEEQGDKPVQVGTIFAYDELKQVLEYRARLVEASKIYIY